MASLLVKRFLSSMIVTQEMWHDGLGYDLAALREMSEAERAEVEPALMERLRSQADWRDVEALWELGTPRARRSVRRARRHRQTDVRNCALRCCSEGEADEVEAAVVESIRSAGAMSNLASTLDLAEQHPTPGVKEASLERARTGDSVTRVNCAALLLFLCGQAAEPFEWTQRPFFLRFGSDDEGELVAAWTDLKERTGL